MPSVLIIVAAFCCLLALAGTAYFAMSIWAARRFILEREQAGPKFTPPVSILKSLKGLDPHMYMAFRSHCLVDYPEYEVLFGVNDLSDPALTLVEKLREEFPRNNLQLVHCPAVLGLNGKVSNLVQMLPHARFEHVLINDSDIVVQRDYLSSVLAPFAKPKVGMVTTLYRGLAGKTLGSKLEALGLSTDFAGGVLIARAMEGGIRFGLGATIVTTKTVLGEIGGLEALVEYLGDDYELGARAAAAGYKVELARNDSGNRVARLFLSRFLGAPDALGAQYQGPPSGTVCRIDCYFRAGLGRTRGVAESVYLVDMAHARRHGSGPADRGVSRGP